MSATYDIPTEPHRFDEPGLFQAPGGFRISVRGTCNRWYGLGGWDETTAMRTVMNGPLVQGPQAYLYGLATVIDNHGGTGREVREVREAGMVVEAEIGDILNIDGHRYVVGKDWSRHANLTLISDEVM